jgi:hypothetical protein
LEHRHNRSAQTRNYFRAPEHNNPDKRKLQLFGCTGRRYFLVPTR